MPKISPYPAASLEQALRILKKIYEVNSGNKLTPIELAKALEMQPSSGSFRSMLSASVKFGLTSGQYNSKFIDPTERGHIVMVPTHEKEGAEALVAAFRSVESHQILESEYGNKSLPADEYGINTASRLLKLEAPPATKCWKRFLADCKFLDWIVEIKGRKYLQPKVVSLQQDQQNIGSGKSVEEVEPNIDIGESENGVIPEEPVAQKRYVEIGNKVFIGHLGFNS